MWEKIKASEYCLSVRDGTHATPKPVNTGHLLITGKHIRDGKIDCRNAYFISDTDYVKINQRSKVDIWDVLMSMIGNGLGRSAVVKEDANYAIKNIALFKTGNEIKAKWLHYFISSKIGQKIIYQSLQGSGQPFISLSYLRNLLIPTPSFQIMGTIVAILDKYDALIENNQQQIFLLEEAAQRLYKEWFVDFRFPGHENVNISNGVPDRWCLKSIKECLSYYVNGGWGKEDVTSNNTCLGSVIRGTDILDIKDGNFKDVPKRYHTQKDVEKKQLMPDDIVFELSNGNIDNIGRSLIISPFILQICGNNTICASFCKLLRPINSIYATLIYWEIQEMQRSGKILTLKKHGANGINNFDFEGFLEHRLLVPSNELIKPVRDILLGITNLLSKITYLKEARDRLLLKLMSEEPNL